MNLLNYLKKLLNIRGKKKEKDPLEQIYYELEQESSKIIDKYSKK